MQIFRFSYFTILLFVILTIQSTLSTTFAQDSCTTPATSSNSCIASGTICTPGCSTEYTDCNDEIMTRLQTNEYTTFCNECQNNNGCCEVIEVGSNNFLARCYKSFAQPTPANPLSTPTPAPDQNTGCYDAIPEGTNVYSCAGNDFVCPEAIVDGQKVVKCCPNFAVCPFRVPSPTPYPCTGLSLEACSQQSQCYYNSDGICTARIGSLSCNQVCATPDGSQYGKPDASKCTYGCGKCEVYAESYRCVNDDNGINYPTGTNVYYDPCRGLAQPNNCRLCYEQENTWTALGCIPTNPTQFTAALVRALFGIAGGIGFLIIIYGAFLCLTARGDAQKTQACRETITAAVIGLLLLIFSIFIINLIFGPYGFLPGYVNIF